MLKNWCFQTVVLKRTLESPWDCKQIKPVHPKGNQLWIFIGRTDAEAEAPVLWPPHEKSWLIGKDPDAGRDWRQEEKGKAENKMVGWQHRLNGHAAAAKSLQSCPTLWDPIDGSPSGSAVPLQPTRLRPFFPPGKNTGVGCHFLLQSTDMNLSKFWEMVKNKEVWHAAVLGVAKSQTQLSN